MFKNVCAVVITYNPDPKFFLKCINSYINQVKEVIIVDNGSSTEIREQLINSLRNRNVSFIFNETNMGIAAALNQGIRLAIDKGFEWVITFDHDTEVKNDMLEKMFDVYEKYLDKDKVGILAPNYIDINTKDSMRFVIKDKWKFKRIKAKGHFIEPLTVITSGSLMKTKVFENVGPFKEEMFIDYVDNEYCLRLTQMGYKIYIITDALMFHRLGEKRIIRIGSLTFIPSNHSVLRKYYVARNRIYTYKRYALSNLNWFMYDIMSFFYDIFKVIMFEEPKILKLKYIFKGIYHGFFDKLGKYNGSIK
ncbi:glycosyltransferase family 2 protein [Geobacillus sp. FSL K6-0789]|uniref:glycosyltransferase family 2 protein n=1 Tax=Geobacillus TaxID=129337 RepID=UPI000EF58A4D|nr:glycosyltransferase family 2 protein [Geobacillus stearothermophilus]RLQ05542.1 glycosyltransferase family 2 protein [Geobacillus stearothermophilus]RLQ06283.1 glycosyltransferase family 2 protein [Geobacillus stearothermophilus]